MPFTYQELGYEKLELLNKTDIKWLREAWSNPNKHTTLHKIHNNIWREYEHKLQAKRKKGDNEFLESLSAYRSLPETQAPTIKASGSNIGIILIVISVIVLIIFML